MVTDRPLARYPLPSGNFTRRGFLCRWLTETRFQLTPQRAWPMPRCGAPLTTADMARAHADDHWGGGRRGFLSAEGQCCRYFFLDFAAAMRTTTRKVEKGERPYQRQYPFQRIILASSPSVNWSDLCLPFRRGCACRGDSVSTRMIVFAVIGLSFVLLGPNWPWLKSRLPRRFAASITRVGSNFRWWLVVLLLGFVT